nr:hypothetical protein [Tanacetum cinerariifolium]
MMLDRFSQHTVDPLALMSNVSHQHHYSQSSTTPPSTYVPPHLANNAHLDSGLSPIDNLIENLTNTLALLTQSYKTFLPQTNNQLKTSSNTRNQATIQDGRVVVQNVQGRLNQGHGNNLRGGGAAGYEEAQNRVGNANPDDYDAFDSDVDEAPMTQTTFMANLSSVDPVYDEAGLLYDSDIIYEVHDHDHYQDVVCKHHEEHGIHDNVQPNHVVNSHADYTSDSNMIPYNQYVKDNAVPGLLATRTPYASHAKQVQPALYNGYEIIKNNHVPAIVHNTEDTLEIAEITKRKINNKMKDPECVNHKVKIAPLDYLKENFLATFTPQRQLTPEQIFWSQDLIKMKAKALKE